MHAYETVRSYASRHLRDCSILRKQTRLQDCPILCKQTCLQDCPILCKQTCLHKCSNCLLLPLCLNHAKTTRKTTVRESAMMSRHTTYWKVHEPPTGASRALKVTPFKFLLKRMVNHDDFLVRSQFFESVKALSLVFSLSTSIAAESNLTLAPDFALVFVLAATYVFTHQLLAFRTRQMVLSARPSGRVPRVAQPSHPIQHLDQHLTIKHPIQHPIQHLHTHRRLLLSKWARMGRTSTLR